MEQHLVPQHIASFEFKLFGNLTMRQFVTLAIPISIATIIFFSNLHLFIRLPLAGAVGIFGLFIALIPVSGRPFDKWLLAFIRAIFSPTLRIWIKEQRLPEFLKVVSRPLTQQPPPPESVTAQSRQKLLVYLRSLPKEKLSPLDVREQLAIQRLELGETPEAEAKGIMGAPIVWPSAQMDLPYNYRSSFPQVKTASEAQEAGEIALPLASATRGRIVAAPQIKPHAKPFALYGLEKKLAQVKKITAMAHLASETNFAVENVIPITTPDMNIKLVHGVGKTRVRKLHFAPPEDFDLSRLPIRGEPKFAISEELKKRYQLADNLFEQNERSILEPKILPKISAPNAAPQGGLPKGAQFVPKHQTQVAPSQGVALKQKKIELTDSQIRLTTGQPTKTPLQSTPLVSAQIVPLTNKPNVLSGIITDSKGTPIVGAILTVRDAYGIPVRALKTHKLGQFLSATPLENGQYLLEIESELANFKPITINLNGQVLAPFEIKAVQN